ncbi:MAG: helix-turn-helix domain-containing protein [Patescibacteria group bacterium]
MDGLSAFQRRMWRAALSPGSLLSAQEAAEALPCPGMDAARWLTATVKPTGEIGGAPVYRWGDVTAALAEQPGRVMPTPIVSDDGRAWLSAEELAVHLSVPISTVQQWTASRRIPSYKFGHRTVRYRLQEVIQAAAQTTAAAKENFDGHHEARRPLARRLPIPGPGDGGGESIPPHDWTRDEPARRRGA